MSHVSNLNRNPGAEAYGLAAAAAQPTRSAGKALSISAAFTSGTDDADVSKFSQASRRLAASVSTQDQSAGTAAGVGPLQHATAVLARMGEIKSLHDGVATDEDRTAFQSEFSELQDRLFSLGLDLFGGPVDEADDEPDADTDQPSPETPGPLEFLDASDLLAADAAIKDASDAEEATQFARQDILRDGTLAFTAQANVREESVLRLVGSE